MKDATTTTTTISTGLRITINMIIIVTIVIRIIGMLMDIIMNFVIRIIPVISILDDISVVSRMIDMTMGGHNYSNITINIDCIMICLVISMMILAAAITYSLLSSAA